MKKRLIIVFLILNSQFLVLSAGAGGPFFVDLSGGGAPLTWGSPLTWMADAGALNGQISNETAVEWVKELFGVWQGAILEDAVGVPVPAITLNVEYKGLAKGDIDAKNYIEFEDAPADVVVVFDPSGEIIDNMFGEKSRNYIVGFAYVLGGEGEYFYGGFLVLNGLFIDGDTANPEISESKFKAAILHEIGHALNLDHTQANIEAVERFEDGDTSLADEIPTMYPVLYTEDQLVPHTDDVIALAELYPSQGYADGFCRIEGELTDANGQGLQGADVVARAMDAAYEWSDVRTFVSGVSYPTGTANGKYILGGIVPDRGYVVGYRSISPSFTGGSSIAPYDPPRGDVTEAVISEEVVACSSGGGGVQMDASAFTSVLQDSSDAGTAPSGGCSLVR